METYPGQDVCSRVFAHAIQIQWQSAETLQGKPRQLTAVFLTGLFLFSFLFFLPLRTRDLFHLEEDVTPC